MNGNSQARFSSDRDRITDNMKIDPVSSCWEWQNHRDRQGYGRIIVRGKTWQAHRLSYSLLFKPTGYSVIPEGMCVLHRCDTPCCVNPTHLFLGTNQDNVDDKMSKGRHPGETWAKISRTDASRIKRRILAGEKISSIAVDYPIGETAIYMIKSGTNWKDVEPKGASDEQE